MTPQDHLYGVGQAILQNDNLRYVASMDAYVESFDNQELADFWRDRRAKYLRPVDA